MTYKTPDLDKTVDHVLTLLSVFAPGAVMGRPTKTWANERQFTLKYGEAEKVYEIEVGFQWSSLTTAAKIVKDWVMFLADEINKAGPNPEPKGSVKGIMWAPGHPCASCGSTDTDYGEDWLARCYGCGRYDDDE